MNVSCSICSELNLGETGYLQRVLPGVVNAILTVREKYAVIPSVGALVPGHSLVVPLLHRTALLAEAGEFDISELMPYFAGFLRADQSLLAFEHGSLTEDSPAIRCGTSHAHLHVLPLHRALHNAVLGAYPTSAVTLRELSSRARDLGDYVAAFTWNADGSQGWIISSAGIASQFMRQRVAAAVGVSSWDWKEDPRPDVVRATVELGFQQNAVVKPMKRTAA